MTRSRSDDIITLENVSGTDSFLFSFPMLSHYPGSPTQYDSYLSVLRELNGSMDLAFGNKSCHGEELAVGGHRSAVRRSLPFCFVPLRFYRICLDRDRLLWGTQSGDQVGTIGAKPTE